MRRAAGAFFALRRWLAGLGCELASAQACCSSGHCQAVPLSSNGRTFEHQGQLPRLRGGAGAAAPLLVRGARTRSWKRTRGRMQIGQQASHSRLVLVISMPEGPTVTPGLVMGATRRHARMNRPGTAICTTWHLA
jgi:hypothetical protein